MQELEQIIKIYHTAFIIFLVLTIIFLGISVLLFFRFNIRNIYDLRTGRGAQKTIQKMEEINAQTGKLRQDITPPTPSTLSGRDRISAPTIEPIRNSGTTETALLNESGMEETALLNEPGIEETALLNELGEQETGGTVLLSEQTKDIPQPESKEIPGVFKIEKEIMWIHTEEML